MLARSPTGSLRPSVFESNPATSGPLYDDLLRKNKEWRAQVEWMRSQGLLREPRDYRTAREKQAEALGIPEHTVVMPAQRVNRRTYEELRAQVEAAKAQRPSGPEGRVTSKADYYKEQMARTGLVVFGLAVGGYALHAQDPAMLASGAAITTSPKVFYA